MIKVKKNYFFKKLTIKNDSSKEISVLDATL
jgi:hypothetical protein